MILSYNHKDIIAVQSSTVIKELFKERGQLDYLFVPVGGGEGYWLILGSSIGADHLSPNCTVIGVESESGNDVQQSFQIKNIFSIATPKTVTDSAQTQFIG
nr:pyridoxal-phosphate dependent enzyme [Coxiella-like endosymbiont]